MTFVDQAINILLEGIRTSEPPSQTEGLITLPTGREVHPLRFATALSTTLAEVSTKIHQEISAIHTAQNALLPVHRLPPEIFTEILLTSFVIQEARESRLKELASVCSRWRYFITITPLLWSYISSFDSPASVVPSLSRSGRSPLHICLFGDSNPSATWDHLSLSKALQEVVSVAERWKYVELEADSQAYFDLLPLEATTAPVLEILKIKIHDESDGLASNPLHTDTVDLFGGRAERLRVLRLDGISLPWHSVLLRQVVELELSCQIISYVELCNLLDSNPSLRRLALANIIPPPRSKENYAAGSPQSLIHHTHLENISLGWTHRSPALVVLPYLIVPACTSLHVDMERLPAGGSLSPNARRTIDHIILHISTSSFDDVRIVWSLQGSPRAAPYFNVQGTRRSPNAYDIRFTLPARFWAARRWIQEVMELINPGIPNLVVGVEFTWAPYALQLEGLEHLIHFLGRMPKVKTMVNRFGIDRKLLKLMSRPAMFGGKEGWLFAELEGFTVVEGGHHRQVAADLLVMVKCRYGGVTYGHGLDDNHEPNGGHDQSVVQDSEEFNEYDSFFDDDNSDNERISAIVVGPPPPPPPFWRTLDLPELQKNHADIYVEIFEVANVSPTLEHV